MAWARTARSVISSPDCSLPTGRCANRCARCVASGLGRGRARPVLVLAAASGAVLADGLASLALEVERCGVKKHDVQIGEQVMTPSKECFLDQVLVGAGRKWRGSVLLGIGKNLSQPGHGPVKVMQVQIGDSFDRVVVLPLLGGTVASRCKEPMQNGEEDGSFNGELPSSPGEFRPEALTEPYLTLSRHTARAIGRRLSSSVQT